MTRLLIAAILACASLAAAAADDLKVSQLEQDVRNLQRQVQAQAQLLEELRMRLVSRPEQALPPAPMQPAAAAAGTHWVDASRWQQLRTNMSELAVIRLLGPPTAMRSLDGARLLLYAMEIGTSGFLSGSVTLRDRVVVAIEKPVLK